MVVWVLNGKERTACSKSDTQTIMSLHRNCYVSPLLYGRLTKDDCRGIVAASDRKIQNSTNIDPSIPIFMFRVDPNGRDKQLKPTRSCCTTPYRREATHDDAWWRSVDKWSEFLFQTQLLRSGWIHSGSSLMSLESPPPHLLLLVQASLPLHFGLSVRGLG